MLDEDIRKLLDAFNEVNYTDSDFYDFCENEQIPLKEASAYIAELNAPSQCHGCKHVESYGIYGGMYPCSVCSRVCKDMYEEADNGRT